MEKQHRPVPVSSLRLPQGEATPPAAGHGLLGRINRTVPGITTRPSINQNVAHSSQEDQQAVEAEVAAFVRRRYPLLGRLNPTRNMLNCNQAVVAVERMLSGDMQVQAPPSAGTGWYGLDLLQDQYQGRWVPVSSYDDIIAQIDGVPGGRGVVFVTHPEGDSHIFNVANTSDGVVFLDGQIGDLAMLPPDAVEVALMMYHPPIPVTANGAGQPNIEHSAQEDRPGRGPWIEIDFDGTSWITSTFSVLNSRGEEIPRQNRSCVQVTVIRSADGPYPSRKRVSHTRSGR